MSENDLKETRYLDENMKKFFKKILDLKEFVKNEKEKSNETYLDQIYQKLDEIIKEKCL